MFELEEEIFFKRYAEQSFRERKGNNCFEEWSRELARLRAEIPELPFSNVWMAQQTLPLIPENSALYLGILNSLRSWNFFDKPDGVEAYANTGGFGIDGGISSLAGAALASPEKLFFGITGDLAFFYDMNIFGNRHFASNIRLLLINNGRGTEFRNYSHPAARFGEKADAFMAAGRAKKLTRKALGESGVRMVKGLIKKK